MIKVLLFISFFGLLFKISTSYIYATTAVPTPIITTSINNISSDVSQIKEQLNEYRNENYQNVIKSSQDAINKASTYTENVNHIATWFSVAFAVIGILFTVIAIIFGYGIFSVKNEIKDQLKVLDEIVKDIKKRSDEVNLYANEARKITTALLPDLIKKFKLNIKETTKVLRSTKQDKESIKKAVNKLEDDRLKLEQQILSHLNQLNTYNSRATIASGSWQPGYAPFGTQVFSPVNFDQAVAPSSVSTNLASSLDINPAPTESIEVDESVSANIQTEGKK